MLGNMGIGEWVVVLVIILIFFGPKRLPGLAQSIGKSIRELKSGLSGITDDIKESIQTPVEPVAKAPTHEAPVANTQTTDAQPVSPVKPDEKV